jgi:hypothetical protein
MGLSVEIAERMAESGIRSESKTPAYDAMMAKKRAVERMARVKPGKTATKNAAIDPIIGRQFQDAWGLTYTITRVEPGHVWARAGMLGSTKRYLRSKIRPCLLPVD